MASLPSRRLSSRDTGAAPTTPKSALRLCVYNYKGGAAKTTIVVNTAAALAHPKHGNQKVLLMDLDPQCNSTQFYHDDNVQSGGGRTLKKEEVEVPSTRTAANILAHGLPSGGAEPKLISDDLHPAVEASGMEALVTSGKTPNFQMMHALFVDQEASAIKKMIEDKGHNLLHQVNVEPETNESEFGGNLWLLEGDASISQFETDIARGFAHYYEKSSIKSYGLISYMMQQFVEILGFDVIIIDCSPSNSALNKAAALACDYIIPPCMPSLYSAGSVHGLLSTVLPGDSGWFGLHAKITQKWQGMSPNDPLKTWLLPSTPPKLLPILITNYAMGATSETMKCEPILSRSSQSKKALKSPKRPAGAEADASVVKWAHTQFVYTIMNYVDHECPFVAGNAVGPTAGFQGPLTVFRENHGQRVINFCANSPLAMPVAEQLGRSVMELTMYDYLAWRYGDDEAYTIFQTAEQAEQVEQAKVRIGKRKRVDTKVGMIDYGPDGRRFLEETEELKKRYSSLSDWLVYLLGEKRGGSASSSGAAGTSGTSIAEL